MILMRPAAQLISLICVCLFVCFSFDSNKTIRPVIFALDQNELGRIMSSLLLGCYTLHTHRLSLSVHAQNRSGWPGASKGTPGDAKRVTEILGEGTKIRKLGGQSLKLLPPDVIF